MAIYHLGHNSVWTVPITVVAGITLAILAMAQPATAKPDIADTGSDAARVQGRAAEYEWESKINQDTVDMADPDPSLVTDEDEEPVLDPPWEVMIQPAGKPSLVTDDEGPPAPDTPQDADDVDDVNPTNEDQDEQQ